MSENYNVLHEDSGVHLFKKKKKKAKKHLEVQGVYVWTLKTNSKTCNS